MKSFVYHDRDGVRRSMHWNAETFTVQTEVDCERLVSNNRLLADLHRPHTPGPRLLARVPMTVFEQSIHENWDDDDWKRWLNDPENAEFRVWQGRV